MSSGTFRTAQCNHLTVPERITAGTEMQWEKITGQGPQDHKVNLKENSFHFLLASL